MPAVATPNNTPYFIELVPEELDVRVYRHAVDSIDGPIACWSYVTDGLRRFNQKEIVYTLRRRPHEFEDDYPRDPFDFFHLLLRQARAGKTIEAGGYSRFARTGGFLGHEGPVGITFVNAAPLRGVNYPDKPLAAISVTAGEIETIRAHGSYRVLSLLGFRSNYFPYPPWSDRARPTILGPADVQQSLLGRFPVATTRGLYTRRQRNQVHVHLLNSQAASLLEKKLDQIPSDRPLVLLTDPDPEAKARLVWKPGMPVETIASDNRPEATLTGGFIAFIIKPHTREGVHVCEDGFAVKIKSATWNKVRDALIENRSFVMPAVNNAMNLICGLEDVVEPVTSAGGHFYQDDDELRERIRPEELTWFDRRIGHIVEDHFADQDAGEGNALSVYCAIRPGQKAKFWLECQPDELANGSHSLLMRRLSALKPPPVKLPVAWATRFNLWGGTGNPKHFAIIPGEWNGACNGDESPAIPDQILDRVWPAS